MPLENYKEYPSSAFVSLSEKKSDIFGRETMASDEHLLF
jgi:hypothetical protein